jgi:predicted AAA+ superfamily ATPase
LTFLSTVFSQRFSFKLKEQLRTPLKVYAYDTGLFAQSNERARTSEISINFSGDFGDELDLQRLGDVFGNLVLDMENVFELPVIIV